MPVYPEIFDGPARNYGGRSTGVPRLTVKKYQTIHNTSNDAPARNEASYAKVRTDGTSSHYFCDDVEVIQSLNTDWRAGHVGSQQGNDGGISWEFTGVNGWTRAQWMSNVAWPLAAAQMAKDCAHHGIAVRLLTVAEMRSGEATGFITHDLARQAWGATDHTDPGPGFPVDHLLALVRRHLNVTTMGDTDMPKIIHQVGRDDLGWWLADGFTRRGIQTPAELDDLLAQYGGIAEVGSLDHFGSPGGGDTVEMTPADRAAIVDAIAKLADVVDANTKDAVADFGEGGSPKVRAD